MPQLSRSAGLALCLVMSGQTVAAQTPKSAKPKSGAWIASPVSRNEMTDTPTIHYRLSARQPISNGYRRTRPALHVRCAGGEFDLYVVTGQVLSVNERAALRVRLDDAPARTWAWDEGTAHGDIFASAPRDLLSELLEARVFRVEVPVHDANNEIITFDVTGLDAVGARLSKGCTPPLDLRGAKRVRLDEEVAAAEQSRRRAEAAAEQKAAQAKACAETTAASGSIANCEPDKHVCAVAAQRAQYKTGCPNTPLDFTGRAAFPGARTPPTLRFACEQGYFVARLETGVQIAGADASLVRWRFDGSEEREAQWAVSKTTLSIASPRDLLPAFARPTSLHIYATPAGASQPWEMVFNVGVSPLRTDVPRMAALCGS